MMHNLPQKDHERHTGGDHHPGVQEADNINCPYLGWISDPTTSTLYPVNANACHRADPPYRVSLDHQQNYCLSHQHTECEGFSNGWPDGFPRGLRNPHKRKPPHHRLNLGNLSPAGKIGIVLFIFLVLAGVYLGISQLQSAPQTPPDGEIVPVGLKATETQQALAAILTPTATRTPTPTNTPTQTPTSPPTQTPGPTNTPTLTPGPALQTPFGSLDFQLLIHEVQPQESVTTIANQYNTTVDVLWLLNDLAARTIGVGDPLVICLDCAVMPDLPPLQPLFLEQGIALQTLAAEHAVPIEDLRAWNGLGNVDWIEPGRWIVVGSW